MKKTILTCALVTCFAFAYANDVAKENRVITNTEMTEIDLTQDGKEIEYSDLPKAVQTAFSEAYSKESVVSVHEMKGDAGKEYKITINNDSKKWALKYNKEGQLLDTKQVE